MNLRFVQMAIYLLGAFTGLTQAVPLAAQTTAGPAEAPFIIPEPDSTTLATRGNVQTTAAEFAGFIEMIPSEDRAAFLSDNSRVDKVIQDQLIHRLLAEDYIAEGALQNPDVVARLKNRIVLHLSEEFRDQLMELPDNIDVEVIAKERYTANPEQFQEPETVSFTQVFFSPEKTKEEAQSVYSDFVREIESGTSFDELVLQFSEEPGLERHQGKYEDIALRRIDGQFRAILSGLTEPGQVSELFKTRLGWHVVRLDARQEATIPSFAEVQADLERQIRLDTGVEQYERHVKRLLDANPVDFNSTAIEQAISDLSRSQ